MSNTDLLDAIPAEENDLWEFKSSLIGVGKALATEVQNAASAFWNSGGGYLAIGFGKDGKIDGGLPSLIGRQPLRDWLDRQISSVSPIGKYDVHSYAESQSSLVTRGMTAAVLQFHESAAAPHMSGDKRYYIRAGAHTDPASAFIVESLWARRRTSRPILLHSFRVNPSNDHVIQLVILAVGSEPAVDVTIDLTPTPGAFIEIANQFPIRIPLISNELPFALDVKLYGSPETEFSRETNLSIQYHDLAGNAYEYTRLLDSMGLPPFRMRSNEKLDEIRERRAATEKLHVIATTIEIAARAYIKAAGLSLPELLREASLTDRPFR